MLKHPRRPQLSLELRVARKSQGPGKPPLDNFIKWICSEELSIGANDGGKCNLNVEPDFDPTQSPRSLNTIADNTYQISTEKPPGAEPVLKCPAQASVDQRSKWFVSPMNQDSLLVAW